MAYEIEMLNITKVFPGIKANDNITLQVKRGEIHALLGENGAGKSTLMSVLFGLFTPEEGKIKVRGKEVNISSPNVATELGIGMVHQHFKLVHNFTVAENIVLGLEPKLVGGRIDLKKASERVSAISKKYSLEVDPGAKIEDISVGMQQRVEILKMLYRNAEIMIFDEPTAVLTPQEIKELMGIMKQLAAEGKSIVVITHKLKEIKEAATRCTVIRKGKGIGTVDVATTSEQELADLMVGRSVSFKVEKKQANPGKTVLEMLNVTVVGHQGKNLLKDLSLSLRGGEILGIAGIEGNGQSQLIEAITGLQSIKSGSIKFDGKEISGLSVRKRTEMGIGHIPEDRHKHGLVLEFSVEDNLILQTYYRGPFSRSGILDRLAIRKQSEELMERFDVRSGQGSVSITRGLSGGNQQKAIIAREIARSPKLLIAAQPTRGLDVGAIEFIHRELIKERDKGRAVLLVSLELEEVLNVSDRIAVLYEGEVVGVVDALKTNETELGLMMSGAKNGGGTHEG
ncbi:MAG: ABC transporter ATP-binding protein [Turicibacter sp.]|nr:ABC transporter ATP-binding protein [Turicibacter sp.]